MRLWRKATPLTIFVTQIWCSNLHGKIFSEKSNNIEIKTNKAIKIRANPDLCKWHRDTNLALASKIALLPPPPPNMIYLKLYIVKINQGNGSMMYCAIPNAFWLLPENNDKTNKFMEIDWGIVISILVALNICKIL